MPHGRGEDVSAQWTCEAAQEWLMLRGSREQETGSAGLNKITYRVDHLGGVELRLVSNVKDSPDGAGTGERQT